MHYGGKKTLYKRFTVPRNARLNFGLAVKIIKFCISSQQISSIFAQHLQETPAVWFKEKKLLYTLSGKMQKDLQSSPAIAFYSLLIHD